MKTLWWTVGLALIGLCAPMKAQEIENFDKAGSGFGATLFPDLLTGGDGKFTREPLGGGLGAPNTSPALPVNTGGDLEGRYSQSSSTPTNGYALSAVEFTGVTVEGYLAIGNPTSGIGTRNCGLVVRANHGGDTASLNCYLAYITHGTDSPPSANLRLARVRDGVIGSGADALSGSQLFPVDLGAENYRLKLTADGSNLSASLWRVKAAGGSVEETPIDLLSGPGVQNTLTASNSELTTGRAGVQARAGETDSVFFDDITLTDLNPPTFIRGDSNGNGLVTLEDVTAILDFISFGDPIPAPLDRADVNDNEFVSLIDAVALLCFVFQNKFSIPPPFSRAGARP